METGDATHRPSSPTRDRFATVVEEHLRELASKHGVKFTTRAVEGRNVEACFDDLAVQSDSHDVAILRLASALLDHPRFMLILSRSLADVNALSVA